MKILLNTVSTKKKSGGAYQIAYNFLVKTMDHQEVEWIYVVSNDLDFILPEPLKAKDNYYVFPTQPDFLRTYKQVKEQLAELEGRIKPDVVYSITAPSYFTFRAPEVMRFTNPWITHPNRYSWYVLSMKAKIRQKLYCWNQRRLMRGTKYFVTQTETTKRGIIRITGVPEGNVCVVKNVLPQIFKAFPRNPKQIEEDWVDIACVGAPVPHKNFEIIPDLLVELRNLGLDNVRFRVTIPCESDVWKVMEGKLKKEGLEDRIITIGRCSQVELADLYRHCHLCLLPTLLEVFSASTLEAMYFQLPVVATNFDFNREVFEDSALYYEPMNAKDAAAKIKEYIDNPRLQQEMVDKMNHQLSLYDDYDKHFNAILGFLNKIETL